MFQASTIVRHFGLLLLILAGCSGSPGPADQRPAISADAKAELAAKEIAKRKAAEAQAEMDSLVAAERQARHALQDRLDHLGKLSTDWHNAYSAQLANVADDPIERDKLLDQNREVNATNERLMRESHETYDPIIADLQRRIREAKAAGAQIIEEAVVSPD